MSDHRRRRHGRTSLRNRVRYRFDNLLARGMWGVLLWLGAITLAAVLVSSILLAVTGVTFAGSDGSGWLEDFWQSMLRVFDTGTMASDVGWGRRVLALLVTVVGLLIAGTLIGLIANGVEQRVDAMRRGRSTVVERDHVVILGASARLPLVVQQLSLARRGGRANAIVVLDDGEPVGVNEEVRAVARDLHGNRLVVRSGDPTRPSDLALVAVRDARAVIALADEDARGDAGVVKAVLAAGAELGGFDRAPIIAELTDPQTAESLVRACGPSVLPVAGLQSVARITAFALREPGLNQVVEELLDFRGCDIHVDRVGELAGTSFGEAVVRFDKVRPIGILGADGVVEIGPPPDIQLASGDRLIVIADDHVREFAAHPLTVAAESGGPRHLPGTAPKVEHALLIGWNGLGNQLLSQMRRSAAPGSSVEIVYDTRLFAPDQLHVPAMGHDVEVVLTPSAADAWHLGDRTHPAPLTSIVLLGYRRGVSSEAADSRTLLNLMMLRRELEEDPSPDPRVVVELVDAANVELARTTGADDYLVSDAVVSRLMAQLAEQPERQAVLLRLYAGDGPTVHLVPAADLGLGGEVGFDDIVVTAYSVGMLAIGWRRDGDVILNPATSERVRFGVGDQIVVIG